MTFFVSSIGATSFAGIRSPDDALGRPHQLQRGGQPQAALARQRNGFEFSTRFVAGARKTDADLMAAEHGVFALRRRVLLIEDLALPAAIGRGVGAEIVEECVAA